MWKGGGSGKREGEWERGEECERGSEERGVAVKRREVGKRGVGNGGKTGEEGGEVGRRGGNVGLLLIQRK